MGDSRSWGAEREDRITICKHGAESKYFVRCGCDGCISDRDKVLRLETKALEIKSIAMNYFRDLPEEDWEKVVSLRIK